MLGWNHDLREQLGDPVAARSREVLIGHQVLINDPERVKPGNRVRVDPFTLITCGLETGDNVHICSHVVLGGGRQHTVCLGNWCFIGYGSQLFCASEDYSGRYGPIGDYWGHNKIYRGDITFEDYCGVASQCLVLPGVHFPEGAVVAAQSLVYRTEDLKPWWIHKGTPARPWKPRDRESCLEHAARWGLENLSA